VEYKHPATATRAAVPRTRRRVLLVDDNVDAADMTARLLELLGHDVLQVYDGRVALELVADFDPDFVLLDVDMPGLNGIEVAEAIRALAHPVAERRIIAVTGHPQRDYEDAARKAGFDGFLLKPVALEQWREVLAPGLA
jgi:CheY-like chemotaxis protein